MEGRQYYVAMRLPVKASPHSSLVEGVLVMTFPVTVVTRVVRSNWRNLGLYGVLMLLVACGLGFLLSTSLTRPVRRIGSAVDAIGAGQLHTRAPTDEGPPELRRLAGAINATSSRLIGLLEVQKSFVEDASHQLRTPLTALQLHLENLQHKPERPSPDDFTPLLVEVGRLNRLVESLLELARNEARPVLLAAVDLDQVARERIHYWQPLAEELGITLTVEGAASVPALAIDGVVEQAIDNLLSNAFDATPTGGSIHVVTSSTDHHAHLHVIDTGVGLSAQERQLALRRFWRGRHNPADGSGLGLAVVDQLIRLSGGSVELLESDSGESTRA